MKNRKRQIINCDFEYMVTARNDDCCRTIQQMGKGYRLGFFAKGHAKNRLYFKCVEKKWKRFYDNIRHLCIADNLVACPAWLQKTILKNLEKSSTNRFWSNRAKKATEILRTISAVHDASKTVMYIKPPATVFSTVSNYSPKRVHTFASRIRNLVNNVTRKSASYLKNFTTKLFKRRKVGSAALSGV